LFPEQPKVAIVVVKGVDAKLLAKFFDNLGIFEEVNGGTGVGLYEYIVLYGEGRLPGL